MTDREYEILDALYFTVSFNTLVKELDSIEDKLINELIDLIKKDWVKCLDKETEEEIDDIAKIKANFKNYNFLASKKGLFAHNCR